MSDDLPIGLTPEIAQSASALLRRARAGESRLTIKWYDQQGRLIILQGSKGEQRIYSICPEDHLTDHLRALVES